jgi:hypothetical protein
MKREQSHKFAEIQRQRKVRLRERGISKSDACIEFGRINTIIILDKLYSSRDSHCADNGWGNSNNNKKKKTSHQIVCLGVRDNKGGHEEE